MPLKRSTQAWPHPRLDDDFGVAIRKEAITEVLKLFAQLRIIINASVKYERDPQFRVDHRLLSFFRQIDDLKAAMA